MEKTDFKKKRFTPSKTETMSSNSPLVCSYVHRQGNVAGKKCTNGVTTLDPLASYCSTHYKLKSLSKDRLEVISVKLDELGATCSRRFEGDEHLAEAVEALTFEQKEQGLELEGHASELSDLRDEIAELSASVKRIVAILASPTLP